MDEMIKRYTKHLIFAPTFKLATNIATIFTTVSIQVQT
jgi:hypothetical protein